MTRSKRHEFKADMFLSWPCPVGSIDPLYFDIWRNDCQSGPAVFRRSMMFERRAEPVVNMYAEGFVQVGWKMTQRVLFVRFKWFRKMNRNLVWRRSK